MNRNGTYHCPGLALQNGPFWNGSGIGGPLYVTAVWIKSEFLSFSAHRPGHKASEPVWTAGGAPGTNTVLRPTISYCGPPIEIVDPQESLGTVGAGVGRDNVTRKKRMRKYRVGAIVIECEKREYRAGCVQEEG